MSQELHTTYKNNYDEDYDEEDEEMNNNFVKMFSEESKVKSILHVDEEDKKPTNEIINIYKENLQLHSQIIIDSYAYKDLDYDIIKQFSNNDTNYNVLHTINPIIAALYLPKFKSLEYYSLHSNMGRYVDNKYNNSSNNENQADNHLFRSIINDPQMPVCKSNSVMEDLKNRYLLQINLWKSVLILRNGKCFDKDASNEFNKAINRCNVNDINNPDYMYFGSEDVILKKILSTFSFRPIRCSPISLQNIIINTPYISGNHKKDTTMSMLTYNLNSNLNKINNNYNNLEDVVNEPQYIIEKGSLIPKQLIIKDIKEILIINVRRRKYSSVKNDNYDSFVFTSLPKLVSGNEDINTEQINFNFSITPFNKIDYNLRSIVCINMNKTNFMQKTGNDINYINGSSTYLVDSINNINNSYYKYQPYLLKEKNMKTGQFCNPLEQVTKNDLINEASKFGTIFIYQDENYLNY